MKKNLLPIIALIFLGYSAFLKIGQENVKLKNVPSNIREILAFGDVITLGDLNQKNDSYPNILQDISKLPVKNFGKNKETSRKAIERLAGVEKSSGGELIIMTLGAEDLTVGISLSETLKNLERIFEDFHTKGYMVAYGGVVFSSTGDNWLLAISHLCKEKGVFYLGNIIEESGTVLNGDDLANLLDKDANKKIADFVYKKISPYL